MLAVIGLMTSTDTAETNELGASGEGGNEPDTDQTDIVPVDTILGPGQAIQVTNGDDVFNLLDGADYNYSPDGTNLITISAGDGDDSILLDAAASGSIDGGAGDNAIYTSLHGSQGVGYSVVAYGGDGDDRLIHIDAAPDTSNRDIAPRLVGGEGSDSFEVSFSEVNKIDEPEYAVRTGVVGILDFGNGVDTIQINAMIDNSDVYTVASAQLQEDTAAGTTKLIVFYEAAPDPVDPENSLPDRELVVTIGATDVIWGDITFIGDNIPPVLQPLP